MAIKQFNTYADAFTHLQARHRDDVCEIMHCTYENLYYIVKH